MRRTILLLLLAATSLSVSAQHSNVRPCPNDLKWMLRYAAPNGKPDGDNEALLALPCFRAALRKAFPLRHSLIGNDVPLAEAAEMYTAVYGEGPQSRDDRHITIHGCVQHACPNTGMIWIDAEGTGSMVFTASDEIVTYPLTPKSFSGKFHLWMYSTLPPLDGQRPQPIPPSLMESLNDVYSSEEIVSVTLIQVDGRLQSVTPSTFHIQSSHQEAAR